jgi:hypothetical protein
MKKIDRIVDIARSIKEDAVVAAPTMSLGAGKIAGTKEAGDDPPVFKTGKSYAKGGKGSRKWWLQYLKGK